jgi:hypothetical protein
MPLFRFHRGSLQESLKTTIIVKTFNDMVKAIIDSFDENTIEKSKWGAKFSVEPYPSKDNNFDPRIGWYAQMVTTNIYEEDKMHPIGFLSEPFN